MTLMTQIIADYDIKTSVKIIKICVIPACLACLAVAPSPKYYEGEALAKWVGKQMRYNRKFVVHPLKALCQ